MAMDDARAGRRSSGQLENETLAVLWAAATPLTPSQVQTALGDLAYNTVHTILTRLMEKGQVVRSTRGDGRSAYAPAKDAAQTAADRMREALSAGADRAKVLASFVTELTPDEEAQLRVALSRNRRRPRPQ